MRTHKLSLLCLVLLVAPFCLFFTIGCHPAHPEPLRIQWLTMGTIAAVQCVNHASASEARDLSQEAFDDINRELSAWTDENTLAAVNRAAGTGQPVSVSPAFADVFQASLRICTESDGAFNPLIGPVMRLWGFNGAPPRTSPPGKDELRAAAALADWRKIELTHLTNGIAVLLPVAGMRLDFGAIAKGYAVDSAWARLKAANQNNLLIDLGGNLRAIGEAAPGRGGWRIGVRNPFDNGLVALFLLRDGEAVATSGNYERFVEIEGVRYAHIMDARTGNPVTGMAGTTVVAPDAMTADALSTTLFILGPKQGVELLKRHPGCDALWIPDAPDKLTLVATPGMAKRLAPISPASYTLTVTGP